MSGRARSYTAIDAGYFDAIGVKLLRGRDFHPAECESKESSAHRHHRRGNGKKLFPNQDAIGQHVR